MISKFLFPNRKLSKCWTTTFYHICPNRQITIDHGINVNSYTERTHNCGQLSNNDIGQRVSIFGWVQYSRFDNKILAIRDSYGTTQCIVNSKEHRKQNISNESVVRISGSVRARPTKQVNTSLSTGTIEVVADEVEVINLAKKDLTILTREDPSITHINRMKYRYLDLRSSSMQQSIRFRSKLSNILRKHLLELDFVECETPTLFNRTPGGAHEFIVPTQTPDRFYSLVQSPQQLKQLLMIGGIDRYFQICRCYRDETSRPDRQPEFTQLDIELSFTNQNLIMKLVEQVIYKSLIELEHSDTNLSQSLISSFDENKSIKRMSYKEAFNRYGTDKPDTRFGWQIQYTSDNIHIDIPHELTRELVYPIVDRVIFDKKLEINMNNIEVMSTDEGTRVKMLNNDVESIKFLGQLRIYIAEKLDSLDYNVYRTKFEFLWVVDFPLFTKNHAGNLESNHHPFTAPTDETLHNLIDEPLKIIGQHYDLVLNGQEIAGGSIRIHDAELQKRIFKEVLGVSECVFDYFIEALKSGCPPHGGIALGLDRFCAILLGKETIRDVIAFPKSSTGRDLLTDCPQEINDDVKRLYHLNK